jgi:hypothetical protein
MKKLFMALLFSGLFMVASTSISSTLKAAPVQDELGCITLTEKFFYDKHSDTLYLYSEHSCDGEFIICTFRSYSDGSVGGSCF